MRSICYTCPGFGLYDVAQPKISRPDDVIVKIAYSGICGSDMNIIRGYEDDFLNIKPGDLFGMGHEASGYVAEVGPEATIKGLKAGDKVVLYHSNYCGSCYYCRNGQEQFCTEKGKVKKRGGFMADYAVVAEQQVYKLSDGADLLKAALAEPVSVVQRGVDLCAIKPGTKVAVSGGGGIGLLFLQLFRLAGAVRLTVIEPVEHKRNTALELGADYVVDPFHENVVERAMAITGGMGFDVVVETSAVVKTIPVCYDILGRGGILELFASYPEGSRYDLPLNSFFIKEAKVIGVFQSPYMYPRTIELMERLKLDAFMRDVYKPEQWKEAFDYRLSGVPQKVVFDFN